MENKNINDDLFEAIIRQAVVKNHENELANMPSEMQLSKIHTFSDRHNIRMKKLFKSYRWKQNRNTILKYGKIAIITISILTSVMFLGVLSSVKAREVISQVIIEWFETFTKFHSSEQGDLEKIDSKCEPKYLPEGFEEYQALGSEYIFTVIYNDGNNNEIAFSYLLESGSLSVNNENCEYSIHIENDTEYHMFLSNTDTVENIITWDKNGYKFTITSLYDINELLKIALSVEF